MSRGTRWPSSRSRKPRRCRATIHEARELPNLALEESLQLVHLNAERGWPVTPESPGERNTDRVDPGT
jgi:hypothetical protein